VKRFFAYASLLVALAALPLSAAHAAFSDNGNGTVTDMRTGLVWDRCAWGQTGAACAGPATARTWAGALSVATQANAASHKGHDDWRLPNRTELESLLLLDAASPVIDPTAFPSAPAAKFWSSTSYASTPSRAWHADFGDGSSAAEDKSSLLDVRLVRQGRGAAAFDGATAVVAPAAISIAVQPTGAGSASCTPNPAVVGTTITCAATANAGYAFAGWTGGCAASFTATTSLACTARFTATQDATLPLPGGGTGHVTVTACSLASARFLPLVSAGDAPPVNLQFPADLFEFALTGCPVGGTATITITYPQALPADAGYWKYGPTPDQPAPHWYRYASAVIAGNTVTLRVTDGALGDDDLAADGRIVDAGGPAVMVTPVVDVPPAAIPAWSEWGAILLIVVMLVVGGRAARRRGVTA